MSRPFATKQGSYYLNVKVPLALRPLAKGQRVSLPLDGEHHSVMVGEKVVFSLRTKEAKIARERFPPALEALNAFFKSLGAPPQTLSRTDARALAGELYRQAVQDIDRHDAIADEVEALRDELAESSAHYQREGEDEKSAELSAAIDLYDERALLAWASSTAIRFFRGRSCSSASLARCSMASCRSTRSRSMPSRASSS